MHDDSTRFKQLWIDDKCTKDVCIGGRQLQKMNDDSTRVRQVWINDKCTKDVCT